MSINKMLIDATHPEETRVVVLRENRVEEFDYESAARKLLRGSIYLAKITRVEPSLQAAFIDYGGIRHGFLAFAEIHPDYYQIPHADKIALLEQESIDQAAYDADLDDEDNSSDDEHTTANAPTTTGGNVKANAPTNADEPVELDGDAPSQNDHDFEANAIDVSDLLPDAGDQPSDPVAASAGDSDPNAGPGPADPSATAFGSTPLAVNEPAADTISESIQPHIHISADGSSQETNDDDPDDDNEDYVIESLNDVANDDDETIAVLDEDDASQDEADADAEGVERTPAKRQRSPRPSRRRARHYKIQEVIKRRQIVLIQVVKEERGNKGAALTTYLSLAGRYTVLMPNTARGGGISRKITNVQDRKRLKAIAQELEVPEGMGLIIRTAGAARTKQEIKRDFEYLLRLWENVRSLTLESTAPSLVYEEGNLIKRSIRDLYTKEIDEVVVAGERAHKEAKGFMRMLMPSHAKNVTAHEDNQSLFAKYRIEQQLNAMFSPNVQLKSGGYLVINQTEALVAIDVNSGKSTREFSIEETALNTNLEAAEELSRQLKLRDLAGLIVVDFIDMEEKRNNRAVERRLKESLRADRARIQVGRISHFGLLEMSRQRLRTGVLEGSTTECEHCQGSGIVRSIESVSLAVLRGLEDSLVAGKMASCVANCSSDVALYLLNQKRAFIQELEERYGVVIYIRSSSNQQGASFRIEPLHDVVPERPRQVTREAVNIDTGFTSDRVAANDDESDETTSDAKPRRRRRRRGKRDENRDQEAATQGLDANTSDAENGEPSDTPADGDQAATAADHEAGTEDRPRRSRRRGRRGGRRHRDQRPETDDAAEPVTEQQGETPATAEASADTEDAKVDVSVANAAPTAAPQAEQSEPSLVADQLEPEVAPVAMPAASSSKIVAIEPVTAVSEAPSDATQAPEPRQQVAAQLPQEEVAETVPQPVEKAAAVEPEVVAAAPTEAPAPVEPSTRTARSQPVASEPVLQRVVVGPNSTNNQGAPDTTETPEVTAPESAKPSRRGWWQRQFGG